MLARLARRRLNDGGRVGVALGEIGGELLDDYLATGVSDAERAGEELLVSWSGHESDYRLDVVGQESGESYLEIEVADLVWVDGERSPADMFTLVSALLRVGLNGLRSGDGAQLLELAELTGFSTPR